MSQVIALGAPGQQRYFAPATETTARHDGWLMAHFLDAGITKHLSAKALDESTALDLVVRLYASGKVEYLLAGLLVEQHVPWTTENAAQNAEWFANLTDPESKRVLRENLVAWLAGFFLNAMPSSAPSPSASTGTASPPAGTTDTKAANGGGRLTNGAAKGPGGTGSRRRGNSRTGTRTGSGKSSTGTSPISSTPSARDSAPSPATSTTRS